MGLQWSFGCYCVKKSWSFKHLLIIKQFNHHPVLKSDALEIGYSRKSIADSVDLKLFRGQLTAAIGINGSGKSTLLKTLTGNLPKRSGEIFLKNRSLSSYSPRQLARLISVVLSNATISQTLTVRDLVALGRHPYTDWIGRLTINDKKAIDNALGLIGIDSLANRACDELSDGQMQKVFIARALAQDTELIVLDEPTNHLDLYHKYFVFKLLKSVVQSTQKAVVFATHQLNLALQICDQIILISEGNVIQDSPGNLIKNGHLNELFPQDLVKFDEETASFKLRTDASFLT